MTKPLVALYWVKINGQRQTDNHARNEDAPVTPVAENIHRPQPQNMPLSPLRKMQNRLKLGNQ